MAAVGNDDLQHRINDAASGVVMLADMLLPVAKDLQRLLAEQAALSAQQEPKRSRRRKQ